MDFLYRKKPCWINQSIYWNFLNFSSCFWDLSKYIYIFLTVCGFSLSKSCFFKHKIHRNLTRHASCNLLFSPESSGPCLPCYDNCALVKSHSPKVTFWKTTFQAKKALKRSLE
jgi:hypothetical protein